jgi:hypothetical protein
VIVGNRSTLSIYSDSLTVAEISAALGIDPHDSADRGEPTRAARAGRVLASEYITHQRAHWSFDADPSLVDPLDETGFGSLRVLLTVFRERANALQSLRRECDTVIWWSGDSDSGQGGFVLTADVLSDLARLGCDLYGTTFLNDVDSESGIA